MIIGDTMEANRISLVDMNFKNMSMEQKREALVVMDLMLKKLHSKGLMVTDFNVNHIYLEDGIYFFEKTMPITSISADNKESAILNNMIWMSVVALWVYNAGPMNNLISPSYASNQFQNFAFCYPEEDRSYYKSILVDSYQSGKIVAPDIYLSDYIIKQQQSSIKGSSSLAYIKATEAGKAFANTDEAAFGHRFFLMTVVASLAVGFIGLLFYFVSRFL